MSGVGLLTEYVPMAVGMAFVSVQSEILISMRTVIPALFMFQVSLSKHVSVRMFRRAGSNGFHCRNVFKLAVVSSMGHVLTILEQLGFQLDFLLVTLVY